jgi:ABC-type thiamine transport system ATPase subunit
VSDLYENEKSRKAVLSRAIPRTLVDKVGLDQLMKRLPEQVSATRRGAARASEASGFYRVSLEVAS